MASKEDLDRYYERLEESFESEGPAYDYNSDRSHNATVMRLMFNKSNTVNMYCGELSVLRDGFFDHVKKDVENGEGVMKDMYNSLKEFLKYSNKKLNIIFEDFEDRYLDDIHEDCEYELRNAISYGSVKLYVLSDIYSFKKEFPHFSFSDSKIIRTEQDKKIHNASCVFNDDDDYDIASENFELLLSIATPIEIN